MLDGSMAVTSQGSVRALAAGNGGEGQSSGANISATALLFI